MTTPTVDLALAGMRAPRQYYKNSQNTLTTGRPYSYWGLIGCPGTGALHASLNGGSYSSSTTIPAGSLYHVDPPGGVNAYLATIAMQTGQQGTMLLCDRLWDNTLGDTTGVQSITFPGLPSRDALGGSNGVGVHIGFECTAITSNSSPVLASYTYTNSAGTGSRAGGFIDVLPAASIISTGYFFRLYEQAGDQGVQSIQSINFSAFYTTGTVGLVAYRVLAALEIMSAWTPNRDNYLTGGFPQLFNGVCPFFILLPNTATAGNPSAIYQETWI